MAIPLLATKLFVPPHAPFAVPRVRLIERLNAGLSRKVTLVCAPAGFGKSTLLGEWVAQLDRPCAWVSLDARDRDPRQFLAYLVGAVQTVNDDVSTAAWALLHASPPQPVESVLAMLLSKLAAVQLRLLIVLDDYQTVASKEIDDAVAFLIDHLPPNLHFVLATREEPELSLGRLRVQGQLTELRLQDLRFQKDEADTFFSTGMALKLSPSHIAALEARTEGWIAGLQLAAISLRGQQDPDQFIQSFTGSNRFVQDFLLEEVLHRQPQEVQSFLLRTSVLDRLCAPLCDAVMQTSNGQRTLGYIEKANLFIVPLDTERRWFRYHHLFAELLRQRLVEQESVAPIHIRASEWYVSNSMPVEGFQQALAAGDIERTIRLVEGDGMPLYFRGAMAPVIQWLQLKPQSYLNEYPRLWVMLAWSLMISGYPKKVEVTLQSAVAAMENATQASVSQDLWGEVATLRAWAAVAKGDVPLVHLQANRALEQLSPRNLAVRLSAHCVMGVGHQFAGNRLAAKAAYERVVSTGQSSGNFMFTMVAAMGLASIQVMESQLHLAAKTYRDVLQRMQDPTHLMVCEAHLGLARILYEWNDLDAADSHAQLGSKLAEPLENGAGLSADVLCARILMLRDRTDAASALLTQAAIAAQTRNFVSRLKEVVGIQALALLRRDQVSAAMDLALQHQLPIATAKAMLAHGRAGDALVVLESHRTSLDEKGCVDESLKAMAVQAVALDALGQSDVALQVLRDALVIAHPAGYVRTFVDEGPKMVILLSKLAARGTMPDYIDQLLAAWDSAAAPSGDTNAGRKANTFLLLDPLSTREMDILHLIRQGDSNQRIGEKLFLSLSTVKWHNQNIFDKLQVKRRTEAVARALELNLFRL